jgi:extracellular elastinolytic metalloproteinase
VPSLRPAARLLIALAVPALLVPAAASAYRRPGPGSDAAKPYLDVRASSSAGRGGARATRGMTDARATLVRKLGPDATLQVDRTTGTVRSLQRLDGTLTPASSADRAGLAWNYVRANAAALGLSSGDLGAFDLASREVTDRGLLTLRWTESYKGIPAFDNDIRVNVDRSGRIVNVLGAPLHDLTLDSVAPKVSAAQALDALKANVGSKRAVSGDSARLVIFGGDGAPRLAWHVTLAATSVANYDAVVDATTGQVLYRQNLTKFASNASVYPNYPGAASGGTAVTKDLTAATTASPTGYLTGATTLTGPNVHAWSDINDDDVAQASEEVGPSARTDFVYPLTDFNATATDGGCSAAALCSWDGDVVAGALQNPTSWQTNRKQNAVQAFWLVNNYHDHLASAPIDFTSPENFQGDDPVLVNADDGAASGADGGPDPNHLDNANMTTNPVGTSPKMQMYLFNAAFAPFRDINGGDTAAVVYHENTHGLSNRLITNDDGSGAVGSPEAGAMGEAWSDWYAEDFIVRQGFETDDPNTAGEIDLGKYTDATPNTIRTQPMDCPVGLQNSAVCPGGFTGDSGGYTFGDFGKVFGAPEVHSDGEIWGETLWDLRAALVSFEGDEQLGSDDAEMLVTDGMRLSPPEPSFLEERNAILAAIQADFTGVDRTNVTNIAWSVFRHRGMGFYAGAADGSDVSPIEDFSPPPDPNGPKGTISGKVTSADTGLPIGGLTVGIGGQGDQNGAGPLAATTNSAGNYTIPDVPTGTYGKLVVYAAAGFDQVQNTNVQVSDGQTTTRDVAIRRDWAGASGGATVDVSDDTGAVFGCGGAGLNDQDQGVGWSPFNPASADPANPNAGPPTATIHLPQTITVRAFLADPGNTCGDDPTATTKGYKLETSPDGATWTVASQGNFAPPDAHRLNPLTPTAGTTNVRYVRLTELSPQSANPGDSGADFIDFSELEVLGAPPNVLPSGSLAATPGTVIQGGSVHLDASSFHDPDSLITGYSWDFDGNGTVDRTTAAPATDFAYATPGTFIARVTANDFEGGGGSATAGVVVRATPVPPPTPVPGAPEVTIARKGSSRKVKITLTCSAACQASAKATVSSALRRKYHLKSRTVGTLDVTLLKPGTKSFSLKLTATTRAALKRFHARSLKVTIAVVALDANDKSVKATKNSSVKR